MRKTKKQVLVSVAALAMAVVLAACGSGGGSSSGNGSGSGSIVRIGSKNFTESLILAEIYALALEDSDIPVERKFNLASSLVHTAIINDEIDLYPEYTGTGLLSVLQLPMDTDPESVYQTVKAEYEKQFNIIWLDYSSANNSQGIVVTRQASEEYGIRTISDLQRNAGNIRFASQGEFDQREDGIPALEAVYGPFDFASSRVYDNALKYEILRSGEADAAPAYTTEGNLTSDDFVLLEDDLHVWPPYNIAPIVRAEILEEYPQIADILNPISAALNTEIITQLNAKVDVDGEEYEDVAAEFYGTIR